MAQASARLGQEDYTLEPSLKETLSETFIKEKTAEHVAQSQGLGQSPGLHQPAMQPARHLWGQGHARITIFQSPQVRWVCCWAQNPFSASVAGAVQGALGETGTCRWVWRREEGWTRLPSLPLWRERCLPGPQLPAFPLSPISTLMLLVHHSL